LLSSPQTCQTTEVQLHEGCISGGQQAPRYSSEFVVTHVPGFEGLRVSKVKACRIQNFFSLPQVCEAGPWEEGQLDEAAFLEADEHFI
jgi:hypothetical protein